MNNYAINDIKAILKEDIIQELKGFPSDVANEEIILNRFGHHEYVIGYYQSSMWLADLNLDTFEVIRFVHDYQTENYGEATFIDNSETLVNSLCYILGYEVLAELRPNN